MKKAFSIAFLAVALIACKKKSDDSSTASSNSTATINTITSNVSQGTWRITKYIDSGADHLSSFSGYTFTFGSGSVSATNGSSSASGTWSVSDSNNSDDNPDDLHFNLSFSSGNPFNELTDDWQFISHSSVKIELIDQSGGNGGTDYLTFEKN